VATLDGQPCTVTSYSNEAFNCEVESNAQASVTGVPTVGQQGIRKLLVNSSTSVDGDHVWIDYYDDLTKDYWVRKEALALTLETPKNVGDRLVHVFKGWFVAPATKRYRFYMTCDDDCSLKMDLTAGSTATKQELVKVIYASGFRDFWRTSDYTESNFRVSEWVDLVEGESYYIETSVAEGAGGDHLSTAVEIEQTDMTGHHHSFKEVQKLNIDVAQNKDTTRITVLNPDDGDYVLNFQD
jgi:hypothetical protein